MPQLLFTIGPPRSGKSTYCTNWAKEAPNRAIVCADSIREALGFEFRQENETLIQGMKDTMIRALLNRGQDVIVDGTHSTVGSIKRIFQISKTATPIWLPSFEYYDQTGADTHEELWKKIKEKDEYYDYLIKTGRETKGEYIIPVIKRIVGNIQSLVLGSIFYGPIFKDDEYRKQLNFIRNDVN